ncbi:hypothetical protein ACI1MP_37785 (plasmid) [Kitasatospora griseola]
MPGRRPRLGTEVRILRGQALETLRGQAPLALRLAACGPLVDSEFDLAAWTLGADGVAVPVRAVSRPDIMLAIQGYGHDKYRRLVWKQGIKPVIACRGVPRGCGLGVHRRSR